MQRYNNIPRVGKKLKTIKFPKISASVTDTVIVSREGDRLDTISSKYYGDDSLYWIIALLNKIGNGSLNIEPGTTIRIPTNITKIIQEYKALNS